MLTLILSLTCGSLAAGLAFAYLQRWQQQLAIRRQWEGHTRQADSQVEAVEATPSGKNNPLIPAYLVAAVAALLRSGMGVEAAWEAALQDAGASERTAETALAHPDFARVAPSIRAALALSRTLGIALAETLDAIVGTLEEAAENARLMEVAQAGPQATAHLLSGLPLLGVVLAAGLGANPLQFFTQTWFGLVVLAAGGLLWVGGRTWVKHLVRRVSLHPTQRVEPLVVVKLLEACLTAGLAVPRCLENLGETCREPGLKVLAKLFLLGAPPAEIHGFLRSGVSPVVAQLGAALLPAWQRGANPVATLDLVAQRLRKETAQQITVQTQKLGVWLALPLGLCYLPAFILLGVLPIGWGLFAGFA